MPPAPVSVTRRTSGCRSNCVTVVTSCLRPMNGVLEAMLPQVLQGGALRQRVLHELASCGGKQDLSSMRRAHDPGGVMDIEPHVAL